MWSKIPELIEKRWWGPGTAFIVLFGLIYSFIWAIIEPLSISDAFEVIPEWIKTRAFYHVIASIVLAALGIVIFVSLRAKANGQPLVPDATVPVVSDQTTALPDSHDCHEEKGTVCMEAYANTSIPVRYSKPFISPPKLEIEVKSGLGNSPLVSDETAKGFVLSRPTFWVGGVRTMVAWKATGLCYNKDNPYGLGT